MSTPTLHWFTLLSYASQLISDFLSDICAKSHGAVNVIIFWLCHVGSGIRSQDTLYRAFFNAAIKLPGGNSAGIVSAFYVRII